MNFVDLKARVNAYTHGTFGNGYNVGNDFAGLMAGFNGISIYNPAVHGSNTSYNFWQAQYILDQLDITATAPTYIDQGGGNGGGGGGE